MSSGIDIIQAFGIFIFVVGVIAHGVYTDKMTHIEHLKSGSDYFKRLVESEGGIEKYARDGKRLGLFSVLLIVTGILVILYPLITTRF